MHTKLIVKGMQFSGARKEAEIEKPNEKWFYECCSCSGDGVWF